MPASCGGCLRRCRTAPCWRCRCQTIRASPGSYSSVKSASDFLPWAYSIARYKVLQYRQSAAREKLVFSPDVVERLADRAAELTSNYAERLSALSKCMAKLSELQRKLVAFRYVDELSVGEIASRTNRATNAVSAALHRARTALAQCIETTLLAGGLR